ncbi:MAG: hypothetical protein AB1529_05040 [Candidatus Micrarchaeota archaeon]
MRRLLLALLLAGLCSAAVVGPRIYEQDDFGDISWSEFTYSISADCTASTISLIIMNESNKPVADAQTYLKYIDFSSPLLSNVKSDKDGLALHRLPGQVTLMRGLFVLVIEKKGYRSKEVHFDLSPCFGNYTVPPPPANPPQNGTAGNGSAAPPPVQPPKNNTTTINVPPPANATNGSGDDGPGAVPAQPSICPPALALLLLIFFKPIKG